MTSTYRVLSDAHLVLFRPGGCLDVEGLRRVLQPLRYETPGAPRWDRFVDFTDVEEFDLDYRRLMSLSASLAQEGIRQGGEGPFFRVAMLCRQPYAFGLARMIASILDRNGIEARPFRDMDSLRSWLGLPPDALTIPGSH